MNKTLSKHKHKYSKEWPGSVFNKKWKRIIVPPNKMHVRNFFSDMHYHLYIKYGLAKAIKENKDIDTWKKIYEKMQIKRVWISRFRRFDSLLDSIYWGWFDAEREPIPVDNAFNILDWSHRLAWLAVMWEHPTIEVIDAPSHNYNKQWFLDHWFTDKEISLAQNMKKDFFQKYNGNLNSKPLGFVWWSTIQDLWWSWNEIIDLIWVTNICDFYIRNFGSQLANIIDLAYLSDWIDNRTLKQKNEWITSRSQWLIWIITYSDIWEFAINQLKTSVRAKVIPMLSEYNFDSIIHSVDEIHPRSNKIRFEIQKIVDQINALLYI